MSKDIRKITDCFHVDVKRVSGTTRTEMRFYGKNSRGSYVDFIVTINWWHWPYIVREMFKAWQAERAGRIAEIAEINATFNEKAS